MSKKSLYVSFSGGRTSALMARLIQTRWEDRYDRIHYLFSNTGQEHEETLIFIDRCAWNWQMDITWMEAIVNPQKGKGIKHRIVNFDTASRWWSEQTPFEAQIAKEGIPNKANPKCSDRLKEFPMESFRKSWGHTKGSSDIAIGIRVDEVDRCNDRAAELGLIYPLVSDYPMTKQMVIRWWSEQTFDLQIPEHYGNCLWCWKKSNRKNMTNILEHPDWYDFPARMESTYGDINGVGSTFDNGERRTFFRGDLSTLDLIEMAKQPFTPFVDTNDGIYTPDIFNDPDLDASGGCSESCDIYAD